MKIVLIEDQHFLRISLKNALKGDAQVEALASYQEFQQLNSRQLQEIDLFVIDMDLEEELLGLKILSDLQNCQAHKLVLTGRDDQEVIAQAYQRGADDYLVKPFSLEDLKEVLESVRLKEKDLSFLKCYNFCDQEKKLLKNSLTSNLPIYLSGETGTGKTTLAKELHLASARANGPMISFNCSEFSENLMESELFGHVKGAYTGALKDKKGRIELAHQGTLFLDEVATMPLSLQAKLLKVIEEKEFYPVGSECKVHSDFKLISASCENLETLVAQGLFREDLYYRLKGVNLSLKPLRESPEKLQTMIGSYLSQEKRRKVIEPEALEALMSYSWPGNYREFTKEMEILSTLKINCIKLSDLSFLTKKTQSNFRDQFDVVKIKKMGLKQFVAQMEKDILKMVLEENRGKVRQTITDLKISSQGFYRIQKTE